MHPTTNQHISLVQSYPFRLCIWPCLAKYYIRRIAQLPIYCNLHTLFDEPNSQGNIFSSCSCTFITYSELTFKRWTVTSCVRCIYFMIITYISIVSYQTRWFFSYIMGHLQWSSIFPTSREHRNILQLCINICINWHIWDSTFKSPCRTPINIGSNIWTPKV